jgi:hypothetical protein
MGTNNHGLSRDIPDHVAREVRQRCGFGCVCCGSALYQYHHFDPLFREALYCAPKTGQILRVPYVTTDYAAAC